MASVIERVCATISQNITKKRKRKNCNEDVRKLEDNWRKLTEK
jgi:hypothetical protein